MKVIIDRDLCIACGVCEAVAPDIFEGDDEGIATVIQQPTEMTAELEEARDSCATEAIIIEE